MRSKCPPLLYSLLILLCLLMSQQKLQAASISYTYDNLNRVTAMVYGTCRLEYSYDSAGNMTRVYTPVTALVYKDDDGDGHGDPLVTLEACSPPAGYVTNQTDCNDTDATVNPTMDEICNGVDDNCDGQTDEGVTPLTYYQDLDGDGYGKTAESLKTCTPPDNYVLLPGDCNDNTTTINPGVNETCNNIDDNCDGQIDEGVKATFYADQDQDGYGNPAGTTLACSAPVGHVSNNQDCDDTRNDVNPASLERCNGIDDNCDGQTDEGLSTDTWYRDQDEDGYGNPDVSVLACVAPDGYLINGSDCNDSDAFIHPDAVERCNGLDDNCDTIIDNGATLFNDRDGDGYGNLGDPLGGCSVSQGSVINSMDCNDNNNAVHPGAEEMCNQLDDNCDGQVDENGVCEKPDQFPWTMFLPAIISGQKSI